LTVILPSRYTGEAGAFSVGKHKTMSSGSHSMIGGQISSCNIPADAATKSENWWLTDLFTPGRGWDRAARYSAYLLIALAVLSGFAYVYNYGVNVYWADDWEDLPTLFEQHAAGTLTIAKFWELHSGHRIFFPKLALFGLGLLTRGNALANMYVTEFLLLAILAIFMLAVRERLTSGLAVWLMVPVAFLVFSLRQWENMLWGFNVAMVMPVAAAFVAFLCLARMKNERFVALLIGALLSATVAAYSELYGLMVWPVGLGQLLVQPLAKRRKIVLVTLWSVVGAAQWLFYFIGYAKPAHYPPLGFSWNYLLTGAGSALFDSLKAAWVAGLLILILDAIVVLLVIVRQQVAKQSFWLAVVANAFATLGAVTMGRSGFGVDQALASRYATLTIPLVIASYVLAIPRGSDRLRLAGLFLASATLSLAIVGAACSFPNGLYQGEFTWSLRVCGQTTICTLGSQPEAMRRHIYDYVPFHASEKTLINAVAVMEKLKYNVFADPELYASSQLPSPSLPVSTADTRFDISKWVLFPTNPQPMVLFVGWAVDWPIRDLAGGVTVVLDGVEHPARYGLPSAEATKSLGSSKFSHAGFLCAVPVSELGPGQHTIFLKILTRDRTAVFRGPPSTFNVNIFSRSKP
jgi:hypothetical protein